MQDGRVPFEMVDGVPVVAAPQEIDITNAPELRSALLEAAAHEPGGGSRANVRQRIERIERIERPSAGRWRTPKAAQR